MDAFIKLLVDSIQKLNIGKPDYPAAQKVQDTRGLLNNSYNNVDLVLSLKNDIKSMTLEQVESFSLELRNVREEIEGVTLSEHGILNVGQYYANYLSIRQSAMYRVELINDNENLTQQQKNILIYILLPLFYLPDYNKDNNPDRATGEKTLSKTILNLALTHAKSKYEYVSGYFDFYQETL